MTQEAAHNPLLSNVLTNLINSIPYPVFCKDQQHRFVSLNDIECEFLGYSREEMLGKSDLDFFPQHECDIFWSVDDNVLKSGRIEVSEEVVTDAYGIVRQLRTKKGKIKVPGNENLLIGISYVLDDDSLSPASQAEDEIFNEGTLKSIENLTQSWSSKVSSKFERNNYFSSLKTSKIAELFLHDREFLREFLNRIPYFACYSDHANNMVCNNNRLKEFVGIGEDNTEEDFTRHKWVKDLCVAVLGKNESAQEIDFDNVCTHVELGEQPFLLCLTKLPVIGHTGRQHGVLNIFDLLEVDHKKGIDLEFYKNSSMLEQYKNVVKQIGESIYDSVSSVFKFADQNTSNMTIRSMEHLASITRISHELSQRLDKQLKARGISLKEWQALNIVVTFIYPTPTIVSQQLGIANSATSKILDLLETKGMIERRYRQEDRRKIRLWYTESGHVNWLYGKQLASRILNNSQELA